MIKKSELLLPENDWREVMHGQWLDIVPKSVRDSVIMGNVFTLLSHYVRANKIGQVLLGGLHYLLLEENENVIAAYVPAATFLRKERLFNVDVRDVFYGTPDLAVEVVSGKEFSVIEKVRDYLKQGTEEVWVLYPTVGEVHRYRRDEPKNILVYAGTDILERESLFPGLQINVADLFTLPK